MQHELDVKQRKISDHMIPQRLYSGHVSCLTCVMQCFCTKLKYTLSFFWRLLWLCVVGVDFSFSKVMFQCTKAIRFSVGILNFCRPMASLAGAVVGIRMREWHRYAG